jgi:hypothetical protein
MISAAETPLPENVADRQPQVAAGELEEIEVVTADLVARETQRADLHAADVDRRRRQQPALNFAPEGELLLHALLFEQLHVQRRVLHRDGHVVGDVAEELEIARPERAVRFVQELQHADDALSAILDRNAQHGARAIAGLLIERPIETRIVVGVAKDERFARRSDAAGQPLSDRQADFARQLAGDVGPDLLLRIVDEVERAAIDVQLVARNGEDGREERVGLDRGVDQLRCFDERSQPFHLVAVGERGDDAADQDTIAIVELQAAVKGRIGALTADDGAVDLDLLAVPRKAERVGADHQRLVVLDARAEDADVDDADVVIRDAAGNRRRQQKPFGTAAVPIEHEAVLSRGFGVCPHVRRVRQFGRIGTGETQRVTAH